MTEIKNEPLKIKFNRLLKDWDKVKLYGYKSGKKTAVLLKDMTEARQAMAILGWISPYNPIITRMYELIHFMWDYYGRGKDEVKRVLDKKP